MNAFLSGTPEHPMYVRCIDPIAWPVKRPPVILLHGGFHTGQVYMRCPDDRPGWAQRFAEQGHAVYVPDWPAHGLSPGIDKLHTLGTEDIARAVATLLDATGPAILLAHSAAGPIAWWLAEHHGDKVAAIIGVAPGSPANLLPELPDDPHEIARLQNDAASGYPVYSPTDAAVTVTFEFIRAFWANSPRFPTAALAAYADTVVPESPRLLNERFNIGGRGLRLSRPRQVGQRPILILTGDHDLRHPRKADEALADYVDADYVWLPDVGIAGNGHLLMAESNSDEIAGLMNRWLDHQSL